MNYFKDVVANMINAILKRSNRSKCRHCRRSSQRLISKKGSPTVPTTTVKDEMADHKRVVNALRPAAATNPTREWNNMRLGTPRETRIYPGGTTDLQYHGITRYLRAKTRPSSTRTPTE